MKKTYVRVLNVLFWVQQAAALCAAAIFFITMLSPGKTTPLLEDVFLRVVCIVPVSAPLFWIAALLRLFRGALRRKARGFRRCAAGYFDPCVGLVSGNLLLNRNGVRYVLR